MDELYEFLDKLLTEVDHLDRIMAGDELDPAQVDLALSVAKRVRRSSTILLKGLANRRDNDYSQEAQVNE